MRLTALLPPQAMDAEGAQLQQIKLTTLAVRTMALPLGQPP